MLIPQNSALRNLLRKIDMAKTRMKKLEYLTDCFLWVLKSCSKNPSRSTFPPYFSPKIQFSFSLSFTSNLLFSRNLGIST